MLTRPAHSASTSARKAVAPHAEVVLPLRSQTWAMQRPLLGAVPLHDTGVQIEGVPRRASGKPIERPRPQRFEGLGDRLRGEPPEEASEGRHAREPLEAAELLDRGIRLQDRKLGKATGTR